MIAFIGSTGNNNKNFKTRAHKSITEYGVKEIVQMPMESGAIYYGSKAAAKPGENTFFELNAHNGLIAGKLLNNSNYQLARFDYETIKKIVANPQLLTTHFWGRYSGCLYNKKTKTHTLLRDPLGLSTLFYIVQSNTILFSNHLRTLYLALEQKPSLDMHYFAEHAINQNHAPSRTPFEGIYELQAGMSLSIDARGKVQQKLLWDISKYQKTKTVDQEQFEQELHEIITRCLTSWFAHSSGICLELSGGLDSSALMIFLHDVFKNEKNIIGVNYFDSKTPSSNEIEYAQEVSDSCSFTFKCADWQDSCLLDLLPSGWYPNRPSTFLFSYKAAQQFADIAHMHNCSDLVNGQGGDHVFLAPHPRKALSDYWIGKGVWSSKTILSELSAINRSPWWNLAKNSVRDVGAYYAPNHILPARTFYHPNNPTVHISADYHNAGNDKSFYLEEHLKNHFPGKSEHIQALSHAVSFADRDQRIPGYTFSHPLLFQPIVEHALTLPTYQTFSNGYDRIALRNSANKIKPVRALWRYIKGETTGTMCKSLAQNASKIEELILDGHLVKHGLINIKWFESEITKIRHGASANMWPLLHLLSEQIWINQWGL